MIARSNLNDEQRLELICEAIRYCQRADRMGMVQSAWTKALREPIYFMWERRGGSKKDAARYCSLTAAGLTRGKREVVYDHAVPFKHLSEKLMALSEPTPQAVRGILDQWLICCKITREEDERLNAAGLNHQMPSDWDESDPFARYKKVGIEIERNPTYRY